MAGFLMGLAKGATPRASSGKPQRSFEEEARLERIKKGTVDPSGAATARQKGIQDRATVTHTETVQRPRLERQTEMQYKTGPVAVQAQKGIDERALRRIPDETKVFEYKFSNEQKAAANSFKVYDARRKKFQNELGSNEIIKPTFDEAIRISSGHVNNPSYVFFSNNNLLPRKATEEEKQNGKAHASGLIIGDGGPNGGFATKTSRTDRDDALALLQTDMQDYEIIKNGVNTQTSADRGYYFDANGALDLSRTNPNVKATYNRIINYVIPNTLKFRNRKEAIQESLKYYVKDNDNRQSFLYQKLPRMSHKQIKVNTDRGLTTSVASSDGFIQPKEKTQSGWQSILNAKDQFAAREKNGQVDKVVKSLYNTADPEHERNQQLYSLIKERAVKVFSDLTMNRYKGAVNFATNKTKFGKNLQQTGQVGEHIIGFSKNHKIKDSSYLQGKTPIIPEGDDLDAIVLTAMGEGRGLVGNNIENIDHILEVVRNRMYHPDFAKQRTPKKVVSSSKESVLKKPVSAKASLATIRDNQTKIKTKAGQITSAKKLLGSPSVPMLLKNYAPENIVEAARQNGDYGHILENTSLTTVESKAEEIVNEQQNRHAKAVTNKLNSNKFSANHVTDNNKNGIMHVTLTINNKETSKTTSGTTIPTMMQPWKAEESLLSLLNKGVPQPLQDTTLSEEHHRALANLGAKESFLEKVSFLPNIKDRKEIMDAFQRKYGAEIALELNNLSDIRGLTQNTFVNIKPDNLKHISNLTFTSLGRERTGRQIIQENFDKNKRYIKFYEEGGTKGTEGKYAYIEKKIGSLDLVYAVPKRDKAERDKNGYFQASRFLVPNQNNDMRPIESGDINVQNNKWARAFDPDSLFKLPANDQMSFDELEERRIRQSKVNTLMTPIKKMIKEYRSNKSQKGANEIVKTVFDIMENPDSELRQALGEYFNDFNKRGLVMAIASATNKEFASSEVLIHGQKQSVGGVRNIDITKVDPQHALRKETEISKDLTVKDAQKIKASASVVIRYMQGLKNTSEQLGGLTATARQLAQRMSDSNMPAENLLAAKKFLKQIKDNPDKFNEILEQFDEKDREVVKNFLGAEGSAQSGGVGTFIDLIVNKGIELTAIAGDLLKIQTDSVDSAKNLFTSITQTPMMKVPAGASASEIQAIEESNVHRQEFLRKYSTGKYGLDKLDKRKEFYVKEYKEALQMERGRNRTKRILTARRNFYAIALTYHFAGLVQGGSGGRAISNEDFENLYRALFSSGGDVTYSNIKRALSISQNALYKADIVLQMGERKGQYTYIMNAVDPILSAINDREEKQTIKLESRKASRINNLKVIRQDENTMDTFISKALNGQPVSKGVQNHNDIHEGFDKVPLSKLSPIQLTLLAASSGIKIKNLQDNITSVDFYTMLDVQAAIDESKRLNLNEEQTQDAIKRTKEKGPASLLFNTSIKNMLKEMPDITYNPTTPEKGGMAASGKTMDQIFELAEKKGTYQKEYQKIKRQFLTSYIRSYINRIYEGTTVGMIDEMGGM